MTWLRPLFLLLVAKPLARVFTGVDVAGRERLPRQGPAIVAANHAEYAILMWAVVSLGAIITSLNGWWSTPELEYGIGLTSPLLIAGDERRLARLDGGSVPAGVPVRLTGELQREAREFRGKAPARAGVTEDAAAVILFTSGTTGRPKGATLSHRNIINFAMVNRLAAAMAAGPGSAGGPSRGCTIVASPMRLVRPHRYERNWVTSGIIV